MSSIQAKLFSIYIDELGNGDPDQNHCNVYLDVLHSLGLQVPPITSREFVDQPSILDISFKKPVLTLTTSLFPQTYEPEILGYTLVSVIDQLSAFIGDDASNASGWKQRLLLNMLHYERSSSDTD